jgi:hypothetical protein
MSAASVSILSDLFRAQFSLPYISMGAAITLSNLDCFSLPVLLFLAFFVLFYTHVEV